MMAAGQAASLGAKVLLLEKMAQPGRKLNITGKGRCNLTNIAPLNEFISKFGRNGRFLHQAFNSFFTDDLITMMKDIGVEIKTERGGRVFPVNDDAPSITKAMVKWIDKLGVVTKNNSSVTKILVKENKVIGVRCNSRDILCQSVIVATGGASYPATGSTGDGYRMLTQLGHSVIPIRPALVPVITQGKTASRLMGLSLRNVNVRIYINDKKKHDAFGEMLFTHFGLSGPIILTLSRFIVDALNKKDKVVLSIDLKTALDNKKLEARLLREIQDNSTRKIKSMMKNILPPKLIPVCCDLLKISPDKECHQLTSAERRLFRLWLKDFQLEIVGHRSFKEAIVTAGGINLKEINPRTMASKIISGLYITGEVLDIDGETGGYNLQAAFSTGYLAGQSASAAIKN